MRDPRIYPRPGDVIQGSVPGCAPKVLIVDIVADGQVYFWKGEAADADRVQTGALIRGHKYT